MTVINLSKRDARYVLDLLAWVKQEVDKANLKVEAGWEYSRIKLIGSSYVYRYLPSIKQGDVPKHIDFPIEIIEKTEMAVKGKITADYVYINGTKVTIQECEERISDDITNKIGYLSSLDLKPLENYLSSICNTEIRLKKTVNENSESILLKSNDLIEHTGICKLMLKSICITSSISIGINNYTGEQEVWLSPINYDYEHKTGGHNGSEFARVKYDINTNTWSAYNYDKTTFVAI